ncbi:hypothetical protein D3C87_123250 [compost metagenome]
MDKSPLMKELREQLDKVGAKMDECPWENPEFYSHWLAQTTYFVNHSSRLLTLASAHCPPEYQKFHLRFLSHAAEEKGHENLSRMDLKHLGYKLEDRPEMISTQSFYQSQYYWIQFKNPLAFFGYILALECLALERGPSLTARTEKAYGPKGAHFLRVHAAEDVDHVKEAMESVEKMPPAAHVHILENMRQAFFNYESMLDECCKLAAKKYKAAG